MLPVHKTKAPPRIKPVQMVCDTPLAKSIPAPLPNTCFRMMIVGAPGSGKSSLATSLLLKGGAYYKVFDRIWVIQPSNSRASYAKDPWAKHRRVFDELTVDVLEQILQEAKQVAEDDKHSLLFIDDQAFQLKNKHIERLLREIYFNARHLHLSSAVVSQTLRQIPINLRKTASHLLTFVPANRVESRIIAEELLFLDTTTAATLFEQAFKKRFDHMLIDTMRRKVYVNWDQIELPRAF